MTRARNIKPGFFKNEDLAELPMAARMLFAGLWCMADREGRMEDRPKRIKIEILPYDDCDIDALLQSLHDTGFIHRYAVDGACLIQVCKWHKHQRPHHKEVESELPAPNQDDGHARAMHESSTAQARGNHDNPGESRPRSDRSDTGYRIPDTGYQDKSSSLRSEDSSSAPPDDVPDAPSVNGQSPPCPAQRIIAEYHRLLPELPMVAKLTDKRRTWLQARWREDAHHQRLEFWTEFFEHVRRSRFLMGEVNGFRADFEWLINKSNFYKTIEERYHHDAA